MEVSVDESASALPADANAEFPHLEGWSLPEDFVRCEVLEPRMDNFKWLDEVLVIELDGGMVLTTVPPPQSITITPAPSCEHKIPLAKHLGLVEN